MYWVLISFACVLLVEGFARLPVFDVAKNLLSINRRAAHTFGRKTVSEHWKERAMGLYAVRTFRTTLHLTMLFLLIGAGLFIFAMLADRIAPGFIEFSTRPVGLVISTVIASAYCVLRLRFVRTVVYRV